MGSGAGLAQMACHAQQRGAVWLGTHQKPRRQLGHGFWQCPGWPHVRQCLSGKPECPAADRQAFSWDYVLGPILGFPVSGTAQSGLAAQQAAGSDLLTGGDDVPEAGLTGMFFRVVVITWVPHSLHQRCERQSRIRLLEFPVRFCDDPPRR